jgi:glycosyltransferase involved in cell wall biosynthesis
MDLSVVVPAYNSAGSLVELVERLGRVLSSEARQYELILVNDGSRDQTWGVIQGLASRYSWVTGVNLMKNYGQHNALLCGIQATGQAG